MSTEALENEQKQAEAQASQPVVPSTVSATAPSAKLDADSLASALKSDPTLPKIPVIFLTSVLDGSNRGKELGAVGYLTKPVRAESLAAMVAEHLPLKAR